MDRLIISKFCTEHTSLRGSDLMTEAIKDS